MIEKEINSILEKFMSCFPDRILLKKLSDLVEINGFGTECYGCMTSEGLEFGDEDFFGYDCVKITICPPASINEVTVIVTNQVFYNALKTRVENFVQTNPDNKEKAIHYMKIIKNNLSVN